MDSVDVVESAEDTMQKFLEELKEGNDDEEHAASLGWLLMAQAASSAEPKTGGSEPGRSGNVDHCYISGTATSAHAR